MTLALEGLSLLPSSVPGSNAGGGGRGDGSPTPAPAPEAPGQAPEAVASASIEMGALPLGVCLDAPGSSDTDDDIASLERDFGDDSPPGRGSVITHTYATYGELSVMLTVTDTKGLSSQAEVRILVPEDLCTELKGGVISGTLESSSVQEASGRVASRRNPGVLSTPNDSG